MKKLILLLTSLCCLIPGLSIAADTTQSIHLEWEYDYQPVEGQSLAGYNLYKEGIKVCTTNTPEDSAMDCDIDSVAGTYSFTLTAIYSDGTESPPSLPYEFLIGTVPAPTTPDEGGHSFTFTWDANNDPQEITGYQIYLNNILLCEVNDPTANEVTCRSDIPQSVMEFTITTLFADNTESLPSNLLKFDPSEYPQFSTAKQLSFSWEYPADLNLAGFKIYKDNQLICETSNPLDRQLTCTAEITGSPITFNLAAMDTSGNETVFSNTLVYSIDSIETIDSIVPPPVSAELKAIITTNSSEGTAPLTVAFDGASSTGEITSFSWSFGDGTTSDTNNIDHLYIIPGTYTAKLTVSDASATTHIATTVITVTEGAPTVTPPQAVISSSTALGPSPLNIAFNGEDSSSPGSEITLYQWTFGDGSSATGSNVSHTFITAGTFNTNLTVTNSAGLTDSISTPVIVTSPPPVENAVPQAVFSTTPTSGSKPLAVAFNASGSTDPDGSISSYSWQFGDGSSATGISTTHTYTSQAAFTATLLVTDNDGAQSSNSTSITVNPEDTPPEFNIELGEISVSSDWARVEITSSFQNPVVIAGPPNSADSAPCVIRLRNISPTGFDIKLTEWDYLDDSHSNETISYIIMEKGHFTLPDGTQVEAGTFEGSTSFKQISFTNAFTLNPVIVSSIATNYETDTISGRIRNISKTAFEYYYREQEQNSNIHATETVNYVAWENSKGTLDNISYEAGTTDDDITHNWNNITFQTSFNGAPLFLADMQSTDGSDTAALRMQTATASSIQVKVEEEQSNDIETDHTSETVGYLALGAIDSEQNIPTAPPTNNLQRLFTFNWTFDDSIDGVTGFRFYQNNELIYESSNGSDRSISCIAPLLDADMQFTMTALINSVETEHSTLLPISPEIFRQTATFTWTFDQQQESNITGFNIYADSEILCETDDPTMRTLGCEAFALTQGTAFTIKAIYPDASTTDASNMIMY